MTHVRVTITDGQNGWQVEDVHTYCQARPRRHRCRSPHCRWLYPPGTPIHRQTSRMAFYTLWTLGLWGIVWGGAYVRWRWGKTGMWIYVGAWCILAIAGQIADTDPPADPLPSVPITYVDDLGWT